MAGNRDELLRGIPGHPEGSGGELGSGLGAAPCCQEAPEVGNPIPWGAGCSRICCSKGFWVLAQCGCSVLSRSRVQSISWYPDSIHVLGGRS